MRGVLAAFGDVCYSGAERSDWLCIPPSVDGGNDKGGKEVAMSIDIGQFARLLSMHTARLEELADEGYLVHPNELVHLTRQARHLEECFAQMASGVEVDHGSKA